MRNRLIAVAAAALVLLAASTGASAASLQFRPGGAITRISLGKITFVAGELRFECNLTLRGNLLTTAISKTSSTKIGEINEVRWANCVGGELETFLALPWTMAYRSISGMLPEGVTAINVSINNFGFKLAIFGGFVNCLYSGNPEFTIAVTHRSGAEYTTGLLRSLENALALREGFGCPIEGRLGGTFSLTTQTVVRS